MHHVQQLLVAPLLRDVTADFTSLEIRHDHLRAIAGANESSVQLRNRQQFFILDRHDGRGRQAIAPIRFGRRFFVHGHAFGKPARHAMIGGFEHEHVAHFVPQSTGPVEAAGRSAGRAIHGDNGTECYTERA